MDKKFNILVVDDEKKIVDVVKAYLEKDGYNVITALDGEMALNIFSNETIHLIVLDLMLPKLSGEEVCHRIRSASNVPIIMLTAKVDEDERIEGIYIGADDYLTKPFSVRELVVRVSALLRRTYRDTLPLADILSFNKGDLEIDIKKMIAKKQGNVVSLTTNEFKILTALLTNPGQVFSREQLVEKAFGIDYEGFDRTIDTHIKNIRHKIEDNPKEPKYIITIYGMGYKFIPSPTEVKK
ncbi:response regulator transcription factor [Clostridium thermopalmarium]|uniref:Stage 0 sporulation protein A homolog n=1 Tax=Clostridium thermopalmarium DSM 5974 TaxID=1121340 RepID=A0A2T0AZI1_9CLOT|nr:response regulator transcription factor [Clostridium thermopalmarium]PRR76619.1 Sensory transduction protein regX3 [Clostridium thermopalmarium DSM 5974]PVZ28268.1 DNA-binding response OmpR family regulator [Clostridium thermopalmarium DSM 5974]